LTRRSPGDLASCCLLCRTDNFVVQNYESGTDDDPFDHIFISFSERFPNCLFFVSFPNDRNPSSSSRFGSVLLDAAEFDSFRRDEVTGVAKIDETRMS